MKEAEFTPCEDVTALSKEEIINKVKEAGVVGMGGAGFPTHVKLSPKEPEKIEYIIANCAECEPYLTADYRRMLENPEELVAGMKIILQICLIKQKVCSVLKIINRTVSQKLTGVNQRTNHVWKSVHYRQSTHRVVSVS